MKIPSLIGAMALTLGSAGATASPAEWGGQVGPLWIDAGSSIVDSFARHAGTRGGLFVEDPSLNTSEVAVRIAGARAALAPPVAVQLSTPLRSTFIQSAPQLDKNSVVVMGATPTPPVNASTTDDGDGVDAGDGTPAAGDDSMADDAMMPPVLAAPIAETDDMMAAVPTPAPLLLVLLGIAGLVSRRR